MAFDDKTLRDLMEEARKARPSNQPEDDYDDFDDDWFEIPEEPAAPVPVDPESCIRETLQALDPFRLTEPEQQTVQEFLTFHLQTTQSFRDQPEARRAYYNLLIHCDEKESIHRFAQILQNALKILPRDTQYTTEAALLQSLTSSIRRTREPQLLQESDFLVIEECLESPRLNLDGSGATRETSKKAIETYNNLWNAVVQHVRQAPSTILIIGCDEDVYRHTLRPFRLISGHICSHHIHLKPQSEEDLLLDCLSELRNSSFTLSDDFEDMLSECFAGLYRSSDLKGRAFVSDLIDQIYTRYYSRRQETSVLTADCIPQTDLKTQSTQSVMQQLNELVGLEIVKNEFQNIYKMQVAGLTGGESSRYHMLFSGNPGTGKTTVARMAADLFFHMGIIKTNKLVVTKPSDLVSEWIGGTGAKAMDVIRRSYNGVLFIDEAYGIATMDRGEELLNILLQEMENHSDKLVVIFAGYTDEMRKLLKANPGLGSRISREIQFDDYTLPQLIQIFHVMSKKDGFTTDPSALDELESCISAMMTREFFGNARDIRNILQDLKEAWSDAYFAAVTKHGAENVTMEKVFLPEHFAQIMPPKKEISINDLVGLDVMKKKLEVFRKQALYQKFLKEKGFSGLSDFSMHMIFTGNPGTGKTTVAKLIADDLYSIGMLKTNRLVAVERKDLVSVYGDTAKKTADVIRKAVGGVLFVDEAYSLADSRRGGSGNECIEVFLTAMEEHKADTVFIFAGYVDEMQDFLMMNPGIQSRIGYTFHFDDYSPDELTQIYADKMHKTGFIVADDALSRVHEIMEYFQDVRHFGNGRFVNHVIHQTISQRANREFTTDYRNIQVQDIPTIKTLIETAPNSIQLYDPATVTPQQQRRTAIHEVGHAVVIAGSDPDTIPESISIRNHSGSLGRVKLSAVQIHQTEQELFNHLASLLGGKNAEMAILGSHSTGCASDYARAKRLAEDMTEKFAMTSFGTTAAEILQSADKLSAQIIAANRERIEPIAEVLLEQKELSGEMFAELLKK